MSLRAFLLGRFAVEKDGVPIPPEAWRRSRPADLFKRVALASGRSVAREQLIDELWPDKDAATGANNLHRALHDLRQVLGGKFVRPDKGVVRMEPDVWVDVAAFEELAVVGDPPSLASAVDLFRGDLCPDSPYAEWLDASRRALRARFVDVALRLARHAIGVGDDAAAIDVLRKLLTIDRTQEEARRSLMAALRRAGRQQEAIEQFAELAAELRSLDAAPSAETIAVHRAITRRDTTTSEPWARAARRLLGSSELRPLRGRDARPAPSTGTVWLVGEPGIGKTRLALEAARDEPMVLAATCLEESAPCAPLVEMWADHLRARGEPTTQNPFFALANGAKSSSAVFDAVCRAITGLGEPPLLVLDDAHVADRDTLDLCHRLAVAGFRLVFTCPPEGLASGTALHAVYIDLVHRRIARRVDVAPLDEAATRDVVTDLLGRAPTEPEVRTIHELAGGNPFYIEEVAAGAPFTADLAEAIRERIARLGSDAEALLVAAAVVGPRFELEVARKAAGLTRTAAMAAVERAREVLAEDGARVMFRHRVIREVLCQTLTAARRRDLHARIAAALTRHDEIASHWRRAGYDARALPHLIAAGDEAAERVGLAEAIALYEEALSICKGHDRFALLVKTGRLSLAVSEAGRAAARFDEALAIAGEPAERARARLGLALAAMLAGELQAANAPLLEAVRDLGGSESGHRDLAAVLYHLALLRWNQKAFSEARDFAERCLALADEPHARAYAHEALGVACHALGLARDAAAHEAKRRELVGIALDLGEAFDVHLLLLGASAQPGLALFCTARVSQAAGAPRP